ncbi:MAG: heme biosynthesis HemY N-terminal domain-containing protein [Pseudomonadota bacterium]|uniref:HemY N-terminal domain-containing protein n=1 Tax=marine metagenome TaxID=408172 RepID=A0A382BBL7_9ZZZZ|nr:heme biosynthesis HemY N-terminal domain-containing protein [Pseudomonadota bacterium]
MVRLFIYSLLVIVVGLWMTFYMEFPIDPGYLLVAFGSYTFETSLFTLIVALSVLYLLFRFATTILRWINPNRLVYIGKAISEKRKKRERSITIEGVLYLIRGNWRSSYNLLTKSISAKDATVINYLAAAYAAYNLDNRNSWEHWLDKAEQEYPTVGSTVNSLRAQLLFKSGQLEQCVAVLERLKKSSLNDAMLLQLLKEAYLQLKDWNKLKELLPALEKKKVIDDEESARINLLIFKEDLYVCYSGLGQEADEHKVLGHLTLLWKKASARCKENEQIVKLYSELLLKLNEKSAAAKVIEKAITQNWNDSLVLFYGEQDFSTSPQQLLIAEKWLKERPANAYLLLSLGRICMRNELWGKAKEYYEASIKVAPCAEACGELSRLLKYLGELEASETYMKVYGDLIGVQLLELPMPTDNKVSH